MLNTLTAGGLGGRAQALQVRLGSYALVQRIVIYLPRAWTSGSLGWMGNSLIRSLSADMEVLYWKHVKEQLETLQKLRRRKASTIGLRFETPQV